MTGAEGEGPETVRQRASYDTQALMRLKPIPSLH